MSLHTIAQNLAAQGRGPDTTLVHMTPGEVKGLQAIAMAHGGSLSINPKTGLPEAGFLSNILPMLAGAALTVATGGAAAPWMIGLGVGGATALATGSLQKGLMAGLGAFGGAGLGTALTAAGATVPATTAGQTMTAPLAQSAAITPQVAASAVPGTSTEALRASLAAGAPSAGAFTPAAATTIAPYTQPTFMGGLSQMGQGVSNIVTGAPGARDAFMGSIGGVKGLVQTGVPLASSMMSNEQPKLPSSKDKTYIAPYEFTMGQQDVDYRTGKTGESTSEMRYFVPQYTALPVYEAGKEGKKGIGGLFGDMGDKFSSLLGRSTTGYAQGGLTALSKGGVPQLQDGGFVFPADVVSHIGNGSTEAGQRILRQKYGAQPIKGPGDGMSDSIPTTIDGRQKALVTDGEAYVDAKTAQKIGPQRLRTVMNKIREARTGKQSQAKTINPHRYLPA